MGYWYALLLNTLKHSYPDGISSTIKTRLSNSYLIGEIFGMLFFGVTIDRLGRRTGIVFATFFLIFGIILATASHGVNQLGVFWMMIVARGIAGFGAGGGKTFMHSPYVER